MVPKISRQWLADHGEKRVPDGAPVRIAQFGEGNFLRAFVDWIFKRLNDSGLFSGTVRVVQPIPAGMVDRLAEQEYVYTALLRGVSGGEAVDEPCFIDVVRDGINPYAEWRRFLETAGEPDLRYAVSNTTEAGIAYAETGRPSDACPESFPAKVAAFLAARHDALSAAPDKGLVFLPCELIEKNGDRLREAVMRHLADWGLSKSVGRWVEASCSFRNTLVDRIVTGFPAAEAEGIWERLGCRDELLVVGECFHLWVIEDDGALEREIPFAESGLNVVLADDLKPYRDRKVRVLNGAHTGNALAAYLAGADTVGDMMADPDLGGFLRDMVVEEILPGVRLPEAEKLGYAEAVFERFRNPFIRHELLSISLNSVSKWKVRVLPSLKDYVAGRNALPKRLAFSLAALIAFYRGDRDGDAYFGARDGGRYPVRDDKPILEAMAKAWRESGSDPERLASKTLGDTMMWDEDLTAVPGLAGAVASSLRAIAERGIREAMRALQGNAV